MKLITEELKEKFKKYPLGSQDGLGKDAKVIVKYFNPTGVGTWLITEADKLENGDYEMFGYCHLGDDENAEFGYVLLSELENIKLPFGLSIERDLYMNQDNNIVDVMKSSGITLPDFLLDDQEKWKEPRYFDVLVDDVKSMLDNKSYTVARVCNGVNCVELHYIDGKSTIEYGTRTSDDSWESEIENIEWFDKNMSISDIENKLENLFNIEFGEKDYEL